MPNYRRWREGRTYFFTVVTECRTKFLCDPTARIILRTVMSKCRQQWPFRIEAIAILPDHLHTIWVLPENDGNYSRRWAWIKREFTVRWLSTEKAKGFGENMHRWQRRRAVFQPRFWEHTIRDEDDFANHVNYIHFNPVKHGYVREPYEWPYSSFQRYVRSGWYPEDWGNSTDSKTRSQLPDLGRMVGE